MGFGQVLAPKPDRLDKILVTAHGTGGQIALAAEILGRAVDGEFGAQREGLLVDRRREGVANRQHRAVPVRKVREFSQIGDIERRIGGRQANHTNVA